MVKNLGEHKKKSTNRLRFLLEGSLTLQIFCFMLMDYAWIPYFTITAEIHARSLVNFYCQYADRQMNLKFVRRVSEREPAIWQFVFVKNKLMSVFNASVLLSIMNFVITLSKKSADPQLLWQWDDEIHDQQQDRRIKNWRQFVKSQCFYRLVVWAHITTFYILPISFPGPFPCLGEGAGTDVGIFPGFV